MDNHHPSWLDPWMTRLRSRMTGMSGGVLADLTLLCRGTVPDFLCPPPTIAFPKLNDELDSLLSVPEDVILAEIGIAFANGIPVSLQRVLENVATFKRHVAELLKQFWEKTIASEWALLRATLEGEMLFRAYALASGGFSKVCSGLHRDVTLIGNELTVRTVSHWDGRCRNRGLLLIPSIFSGLHVSLTICPPWQPTIVYPCRGIADLVDGTNHQRAQGLDQLLGYSCAKIIANLKVPHTTLEMAAALKLSKAATSEQLTKLWNAGVLERRRIGRHVFYYLNQRGTTLLRTFCAGFDTAADSQDLLAKENWLDMEQTSSNLADCCKVQMSRPRTCCSKA
jgi:DNA-binding transcriptional ArsR family regulator